MSKKNEIAVRLERFRWPTLTSPSLPTEQTEIRGLKTLLEALPYKIIIKAA